MELFKGILDLWTALLAGAALIDLKDKANGEPLFYCQFDGFDLSRTVKLVQAEKTPELLQYMEQISGEVNYVKQTFSLFGDMEKVRPKRVLK